MRKPLLVILVLLALLLAGGSYFWWNTLKWTGELTSLQPHFGGTCESIKGIVGAEDIVIDHENGQAYISSHDRRNRDGFGSIWIMPVSDPHAAKPLTLKGYDAPLFSPHGIDLWVDKNGLRWLFVIDHGDWSTSRIVVFRILDDVLIFDHAIIDPLILRPNDVAAVGKNAFYVTNDLGAPYGSRGEFTEVLFRKTKGNLVYYDGKKASIAADKIGYANGVAVSEDTKSLYIGAIIDQSVRVYYRDTASGKLTLQDTLVLHTGVDNIDVDEEGVLWVAAHPKLLTFSKHAKDAAVRSPSQIFRIDPTKKTIHEVYLSNGDPLSGASVGARSGNTLLIGGVFDPQVLACTLPTQSY